MLHVTRADYLDGYRIRLDFNDGFSGTVDLCGRLTGPIFEPLNDVDRFRQFEIGGHTLCWQNGADLAPEYLRELANGLIAEQGGQRERSTAAFP
jgi:hypothetical protein